jgi:hypothetical protein
MLTIVCNGLGPCFDGSIFPPLGLSGKGASLLRLYHENVNDLTDPAFRSQKLQQELAQAQKRLCEIKVRPLHFHECQKHPCPGLTPYDSCTGAWAEGQLEQDDQNRQYQALARHVRALCLLHGFAQVKCAAELPIRVSCWL